MFLQAQTLRLRDVSRDKFLPPPRVDSAVVSVSPRAATEVIANALGPDVAPAKALALCRMAHDCNGHVGTEIAQGSAHNAVVDSDLEREAMRAVVLEWDKMTRVCFHRKNRTLRALFRQQLERLPEPQKKQRQAAALSILDSTGLSQKRARHMSFDDFRTLFQAFLTAGQPFPSQ